MSRLTEQELTEILDENKGISMVNPNRVYRPCRLLKTLCPLCVSLNRQRSARKSAARNIQ